MSTEPPAAGEKRRERSLAALKPLLPYALRNRGRIALAVVALTVASAATLTFPFAVRRMIDFGFSGSSAGLINSYFAAMLAVVGALALASGCRYYLVMTIGERVVADLRDDVFAHLSRLDASFYDSARVGELVSRLTADTTQLKSAFGASASILLRNLFMFVGAIALMVLSSPKLSGLVLVAIPIIVFPLIGSGRLVRKRSRRAQDTLANASAFAAENLSAVRTMQAFGAEKATTARFAREVEEAYDAARTATKARSILTATAIFMAFASVIGVLWYGAHDVLDGKMTGGMLSQFVLYAVLGASSLGELSQVWSEVAAASGAAGRIADLLSVQPKIFAPAQPAALPTPARGEVAFDRVTFSYPAAPQAGVVDDLTFKVAPGERVAIVGASGAGKSTLFQLMARFYDPQSGRVMIDGVDIKTVDPAELRARIALVAQEATIFAATVAENIAYGKPEATREEVIEAAKRAAADGFIRELDKGYDSVIGERGVTLSGGQRQRLAIARAILKDAPILLLDEATSALDAENEAAVQKALHGVMENRTTLVIAHRLATVLEADRILVMEAGRVVEEGTHATLVARNGIYARLARLQFETGAAALAGDKAAE